MFRNIGLTNHKVKSVQTTMPGLKNWQAERATGVYLQRVWTTQRTHGLDPKWAVVAESVLEPGKAGQLAGWG
jgi:hypothetical protein